VDFQKIVAEILETGMTQTELAKRCGNGTTQGHISAIYTGRRGDSVGLYSAMRWSRFTAGPCGKR